MRAAPGRVGEIDELGNRRDPVTLARDFCQQFPMPLTLLALRPGHRAAVIEMGMNHPGEISLLSRLTRPRVAVITNVSEAHLAGVGSRAGVARAKAEIVDGLGDTVPR